jgi:hypothetical protein
LSDFSDRTPNRRFVGNLLRKIFACNHIALRRAVSRANISRNEPEIWMQIYKTALTGALILAMGAVAGRAEDCSGQFSADSTQVYSSLSAANQQILDTKIKNKAGEPTSCDFKRGLLDILANYPPDKRDADLKQLLDKMLIHTP